MKLQRKLLLGAGALAIAVGLAACGGGGGGGGFAGFPVATTPPPTTTTPPPAQADPYDKFLAYLADLVSKLLDTSEPDDVAQYDPAPTSETLEPVALP